MESTKKPSICISSFFGGVFLFFIGENKSDSKKITVRNGIMAVSSQQKDVFREVLLYLIGIHFRNYGIYIDPGHRQRCFWHRLHAVGAISRSRRQTRSHRRSVSCDLVNVNKHKLWNFNRPLGMPGHRRRCVWCWQCVISAKNRKTMARVHDTCCCRQSWIMSPPFCN